jgi:hypothetical protein
MASDLMFMSVRVLRRAIQPVIQFDRRFAANDWVTNLQSSLEPSEIPNFASECESASRAFEQRAY